MKLLKGGIFMVEHSKTIARNKKARHEYFIEATYECGLVLSGTEVKSLRQGKVSLKESYADIRNNEIFVFQMNITPYEHGNIYNKDPLRERKLLLHKQEIQKLIRLKQRDGYALIPLSLYFKNGRVKLQLALGRGKKNYDKRHSIAERDAKKRIQRNVDRA